MSDYELFAAIPERAASDARLGVNHYRVLVIMGMHDRMSAINGGEGCWSSQQTMASEIGVAPSNFSTAAKELVLWGYLERTPQIKDKHRWTYRIIYNPEKLCTDITSPGEVIADGGEVIAGNNSMLYSQTQEPNKINDMTTPREPRTEPYKTDGTINGMSYDTPEPSEAKKAISKEAIRQDNTESHAEAAARQRQVDEWDRLKKERGFESTSKRASR